MKGSSANSLLGFLDFHLGFSTSVIAYVVTGIHIFAGLYSRLPLYPNLLGHNGKHYSGNYT